MALADLRAESTAISYDPVEAGRCVAAFANIVKACTDTDDSVEDACDRIYNGTLAAGQPCTDSNECTDPPGGYASCETDLVDGVSRCKTYEDIVSVGARGALGDACATTCTTEPGGQGCSGGIVVGPPGVGGGPTAQPGNAACFTNDGLFCDFTTYLCTALIPIGQPCSSSGCVAGAFCEASVCTAQRTSGSCLQYYDACASTAYCDQTGNCALKKPDGASCTYGDECTGGECTESSVCALASIASQEICSGIVN